MSVSQVVGGMLVCPHTVLQVCRDSFFHMSNAIEMKLDMCHLYEGLCTKHNFGSQRLRHNGVICLCVRVGGFFLAFIDKPIVSDCKFILFLFSYR